MEGKYLFMGNGKTGKTEKTGIYGYPQEKTKPSVPFPPFTTPTIRNKYSNSLDKLTSEVYTVRYEDKYI